MPLRDDLLNPIPGENPGGENLRHAPVYDKIKEARREDDDAPQGDWQFKRKTADWGQVLKLGQESIASKSKDLQIAAWVTEALLNTDGVGGLRDGLLLIRSLIENFWDYLYPELEDGDSEFRAAPVEWVGGRLDIAVKKAPFTKSGGFSFLRYHESRTVPSEADVAENSEKAPEREEAIKAGKPTPEEWEKALNATPAEFLEKIVGDMDSCLQVFEELQALCEEKFGEFAPSFQKTRTAVEDVRHLVGGFYDAKKAPEPEPEPEPVAEEETAASDGWSTPAAEDGWSTPEEVVEKPVKKAARKITSAEPADKDDAASRIAAVAAWMRREDAYNPAPFLMLRGFRWGELKQAGSSPDPMMLEAPPSDVRQNIKKLAGDSSWAEVIEIGETAMAEPCGRGWLDLQRQVVRACEELGYETIANAIKSEVRALLADIPELPQMTLSDDTPTANKETQKWLSGLGSSAPTQTMVVQKERELGPEELGEPEIDTYDMAVQAARSGQAQEAMELMTGEIGRQTSGRGRFQRKLQLAQLCVQMGYEEIARSILEELSRSIEKHLLEEWESSELVAQALLMLYNCLKKTAGDPVEMKKLYSRICRLDPMQALVAHAR